MEIRMIVGGFAGEGTSHSTRKAYAKRLRRGSDASPPPERSIYPNSSKGAILFNDQDSWPVHQPHDDPLVISLLIGNHIVRRVLVYTGSSADILSAEAFSQMGMGQVKLQPMNTSFIGFVGDKVYPLGTIQMTTTIGEGANGVSKMITYLIADVPSAYNVILGRPALHQFRAVVSVFHFMVKFSTKGGEGCVRGDLRSARECYVTSLKDSRSPKTPDIAKT